MWSLVSIARRAEGLLLGLDVLPKEIGAGVHPVEVDQKLKLKNLTFPGSLHSQIS